MYLVNEMRVAPAMLGGYMAMMQAAGMLATSLSGTLSDRMGPKRVATTGMGTMTVGLVALATVNARQGFGIVLAAVGFFIYSLRPSVFRWAIGAVPHEYEGMTVGVLFTTQAVFSTMVPLIGGSSLTA